MKIAIIIVRVLLGLLFIATSVMFFLNMTPPPPPMTGNTKEFMEGLGASGYIMPVVKAIELLCGLALVSGFFVPLATVVIFPITVNIVLVHAIHMPEGLPMALFVLVANLFLAYAYFDRYKPMLAAK